MDYFENGHYNEHLCESILHLSMAVDQRSLNRIILTIVVSKSFSKTHFPKILPSRVKSFNTLPLIRYAKNPEIILG